MMTRDPNEIGRSASSEVPDPGSPEDGSGPTVSPVPAVSPVPVDPWRPVQPKPEPRPPQPVPYREPPTRAPLPVPLRTVPPGGGAGISARGPRRADDRRVAVVAVVIAAGYLVAALVASVASAAGAALISPWLPLHLALAGGASTAIAGVMPFFVAALAAGPPAGRVLRMSAVALVAVGAGIVSLRGIVPAATVLPPIGGSIYLLGIGATALAVRNAGRAGLMMRRPIVTIGYTMALFNVAVGGLLATLMVAGWQPVLEHWARLRPAHAWTNLLGFVSLVIVATLLHFLPTVLGTRILPRRSAVIAVLGLAMGVPIVVVGLLLGWAAVAGGGALLALAGALAMALEAVLVVRDRGHWTSDPGWHRFASVGLLAGVAWFVLGVGLAAWLVLAYGASGDAWSTVVVGAPLVLGWVAQVLMASWTHLLPSIGPGGPVDHARQRAILGRVSAPRLLALNVGVALVAVGWPLGIGGAAMAGAGLVTVALLGTVALTVLALRVPRSA